jgi:hypothetical protein
MHANPYGLYSRAVASYITVTPGLAVGRLIVGLRFPPMALVGRRGARAQAQDHRYCGGGYC